jgi:ADP-heptose:LPS heptosyltransferase
VFFLALIGVPVRIGYNFKGRGRFLTHKIDIAGYHDKHIVEYYLDLLDLLHVDALQKDVLTSCRDSGNLEIFIPQEDLSWADNFLKDNSVALNERLFAIIPGGGASWGDTAIYKRWPAENFAKAADELIDKYGGAKIIILGGPEDAVVCDSAIKAMGHRAVDACRKTSLLQLAALLKKCELVICNDGGPLHIAVAMAVKTVSIFGPVDENVYGPYPVSSKHIVMKEALNCRPCYKRFKFNKCQKRLCLLNIRPQDVIKAAENLL